MQGMKRELTSFLAKKGLLKKFYDHKVLRAWNQVVGKDIAQSCQPYRISGHKLIVACANSMWIQELTFRKRHLLDKLNEAAGKKVISDIKFISGHVTRQNHHDLSGSDSFQVDLTNEENQWIHDLIEDVSDDEMKSKIKRILKQDLLRKKTLEKKGYTKCTRCQFYTQSTDQICSQCKNKEQEKRMRTVLTYLRDLPWLSYEEVRQLALEKYGVPVSQRDYNRSKHILFNRVKDELKRAYKAHKYHQTEENYGWVSQVLHHYVLIVTEKKPEEIDIETKRTVVGALGKNYLQFIKEPAAKDE